MPDRKFATWTYQAAAMREAYDFEVRVKWGHQDGGQHYHPNDISVGVNPTFYVETDDPAVSVEDGDLTKLAEKLREAVDGFYAMEWEPVLGIQWEQRTADEDSDRVLLATEMSIKVEPWQRGYSEETAKVLWAEASYKGTGRGAIHREHPTYYFVGAEGRQLIAFVPDTPENRAILMDLDGKLGMLASILRDLLTGDRVTANLQTLSRLALPEKT